MTDDWLDLLPIESLPDLCAGLARRWGRTLGVETLVVTCLSVEGNRVLAGRVGEEQHGCRVPLPVPVATWSDELARHTLSRWIPESATATPIGTGAFAGVHMVGPVDESLRLGLVAATERLLAQGRLVDRLQHDALAEKLESMAEFAAGAGHEINNPLATINGRVQLLLKGESDPERRRALEVIGGQAYRVRDMIGDAMLFARPPAPERTTIDLAEVARTTVESLRTGIPDDVTLAVEATDPVPLYADGSQLAIVVTELVRNALHAVDTSGRVEVAVAPGTFPPNHVTLTVTDDGPGLTDLDRVHLFDPFYSGRQAGRGLGFGLSKAWRIVRMHGGRIDVHSTPGRTRVNVVLPAEREPQPVA